MTLMGSIVTTTVVCTAQDITRMYQLRVAHAMKLLINSQAIVWILGAESYQDKD